MPGRYARRVWREDRARHPQPQVSTHGEGPVPPKAAGYRPFLHPNLLERFGVAVTGPDDNVVVFLNVFVVDVVPILDIIFLDSG